MEWGRRRSGFEGESLLLRAESVERVFSSGVGGGGYASVVGACEGPVVVQGVLEDGDDGLLEGDDLGLELVFC